MYGVEFYTAVRLEVVGEGVSRREGPASRHCPSHGEKRLSYSSVPGYRRNKPVRRSLVSPVGKSRSWC